MKNKTNHEEVTFKEEVPESELHSKIDVDDHIYVTKRGIYGLPFLIFLAIILILASLFSFMFGIVSLNNNEEREIGVTTSKYNLIVMHSNDSYGGAIEDFTKYSTKASAYEYDFSVSNSNNINIKYSIDFENTKYDFSKLDMSLINYELVKNSSVIKSGKLKNDSKYSLYKTDVMASSLDEYKIKIWSNEITKTSSFAFKINIDV